MPETLNLDTAAVLNIVLAEHHSFDIVMDHFEADGTTPRNLTGTFKMSIAKRKNPNLVILALTQGAGLTVLNNRLSISRNVLLNILKGPDDYIYDIRNDLGGNISVPMYRGSIHVNDFVTLP